MQTFFKRLLHILENEGFKNLNDFALNGLKYDSSSKLNRLKDDKNKPSVEILMDIANKFENINLHWLITGKGKMIVESGTYLASNEISKVQEPPGTSERITAILENELLQTQRDLISSQKEQLAYYKELIADLKKEQTSVVPGPTVHR